MKESLFYKATQRGTIRDLNIPAGDRQVLKELAKTVRDCANEPDNLEKKARWVRHCRLEDEKPLVICDPENGWNEIIPQNSLSCESEGGRTWEGMLRRKIFYARQMGDDTAIDARLDIPYTYGETSWGAEGRQVGTGEDGAFHWEAALESFSDLGKLRIPELCVDYDHTNRTIALAREIMGTEIDIKLTGKWWHSLGITNLLGEFRGFERILYDFYDYPDEVHRLMRMLTDYYLRRITELEEKKLLTLNNETIYVPGGIFGYTDLLPQDDFAGDVRAKDLWVWAEAQEVCQISPQMFHDFVFVYQKELLERFGLVSYGCCEAVNERWDDIKTLKRLLRVSVSPWADKQDMAEKLGGQYLYAWKVNPAMLAVDSFDSGTAENEMRELMHSMKKNRCRVEVVMKDNHTIHHNPDNVLSWCRLAKRLAEEW